MGSSRPGLWFSSGHIRKGLSGDYHLRKSLKVSGEYRVWIACLREAGVETPVHWEGSTRSVTL